MSDQMYLYDPVSTTDLSAAGVSNNIYDRMSHAQCIAYGCCDEP